MSLNDHGFLDVDIKRLSQAMAKRHVEVFQLARDVNACWQRLKFRLRVHSRDPQELLAAALLIKMLNDFQASVLLLERALVPQGQALLRCCLEALLILRRAALDHEFCVMWSKSDARDRLRMLKAVRDDATGLPDSIDPDGLAERIASMESVVEKVGAKAVRIADVMPTGRDGWLTSLYMVWSFPVHAAPHTLNRYLDRPPGKEVQGLNWGPSEDDLDTTLHWGVAVMLEAGPPIDTLFSLGLEPELRPLHERLRDVMTAGDPEGASGGAAR